MPSEMVQKTQISKILMALEEGKAKDFAGRTLKEMDSSIDTSGILNKKVSTSNIRVVELKNCETSSSESETEEPRSKRRKCVTKKINWSETQKKLPFNIFKKIF